MPRGRRREVHAAEAPRVVEPQAPAAVELEVNMIVHAMCERPREVAQRSRHAEMHEQSAAGVSKQQVFAAPRQSVDSPPAELRR